jgi:hypothetical protein
MEEMHDGTIQRTHLVEKRSRTAVSSSSSRIEVLLAWIFLLDKALFFNLS